MYFFKQPIQFMRIEHVCQRGFNCKIAASGGDL